MTVVIFDPRSQPLPGKGEAQRPRKAISSSRLAGFAQPASAPYDWCVARWEHPIREGLGFPRLPGMVEPRYRQLARQSFDGLVAELVDWDEATGRVRLRTCAGAPGSAA